MQYDFWNNPLVVTAMRLKYRRGSPGFTTGLYALVLLAIGALLFHYEDNFNKATGLVFLLIILCVQLLISGGIALFSVATSMNNEVLNRTLDFQRIVSLKPMEIIWGKMLGEPLLAYFLTLGSLPFAILCWAVGSASLIVIVLFYVNILTSILLCSALGSIHTLVPATTAIARGGPNSRGAAGFFWVPFIFLPSLLSSGTWWQQEGVLGVVFNILTPIGSLQYLLEGDPWSARVYLWNWSIPSLVIAPLAQFSVVCLIVTSMSRRLKNIVEPPVKRSQTYVLLLIVDLVFAGAFYKQWLEGALAGRLVFQFGLAHLVVSLLLLFGITPNKAVLKSWVWRFQTRDTWLRGSLWGSRADITAVLGAYSLIGASALILGFAVPTYLWRTGKLFPAENWELGEVIVVTSVLTISFGLMYQLCLAIMKKGGAITFVVFLLLLNLMPMIATSIMVYPQDLQNVSGAAEGFLSLSPAAYYLLTSSNPPRITLTPYWLILLNVLLAILCYRWMTRWLRVQHQEVLGKLKSMEVV